jgi:hypothetical protein
MKAENPVLEKIRRQLLHAALEGAPRRRRHGLVAVLVGAMLLAGAAAASAVTRTGPLAHVLAGSEIPIPVPRHPVPTQAGGQCEELFNLADGRAEPTVKRLDPRLLDMLGVFRRPQRPQEAVTNCGIELEDGENFALGRAVALPGGEIAFLWPARHAVCVGVSGFGNCPDLQVLRRHGVAIAGGFNTGVPRGMMRVFGVARDDVSRLVFTLPDGRETTAPIVDNAFSVLLPIGKITAERIDHDGSRRSVPGVPDFSGIPG